MDNQITKPIVDHESSRPYATVSGEALHSWPQDLYLPANALEVVIEAFEGPLDLLLYLIRKQKIDILDIPIAQVTHQYVEYVELMQHLHLDQAAEYLVMAAMLAEIKSRMLIPRHEVDQDEEEDPRAVLVRRLQEYERFRDAATQLDERPRLERELYLVQARIEDAEPVQDETIVDLSQLLSAMRDAILRVDQRRNLQLVPETLSVRDRMNQVLTRVRSGEYVRIEEFFSVDEGRAGLIVSFLAVLELVRDRLLVVVQTEPLSPIHVKLTG